MSIDVLLQQIVNGLVVGSVYALVALGYTMVYGILPVSYTHLDVYKRQPYFRADWHKVLEHSEARFLKRTGQLRVPCSPHMSQ